MRKNGKQNFESRILVIPEETQRKIEAAYDIVRARKQSRRRTDGKKFPVPDVYGNPLRQLCWRLP